MSKLTLVEQATAPDTPGSGRVSIFVDTNGDLAWKDDAGNVIKVAAAGSYTLTIPATGTAALLGTAQTFSAAQTFSNALVAPGMKPAADSTTALQLQKSNGTAVLTVDTTNSRVILSELGVGAAASLLSRPVAGSVRQGVETTTIANGATLAISTSNAGFVFISDASDGALAIIVVAGAGGTLIYGSTSIFSGTAGTASRMNVYATGGQITVQNNLGSSKVISAFVIL